MTFLYYLIVVVGVMAWAPLLRGRSHVRPGIVESIAVFGGAFLFGSCFVNLVPHMYIGGFATAGDLKVGAAVLVGFLVQLVLEILTGGLEHGSQGVGAPKGDTPQPANPKADVPLAGLMIGLCIHAFLEGMPLIDMHDGVHLGLLWGIVLHNIPISLVLVSLFVASGTRPAKAALLMLLFAVMTPLGSLANNALFGHDAALQQLLMGLVVGILLHVSISILFGDNGKRLNWNTILLVVIAFVAAYYTPGCPEIYG